MDKAEDERLRAIAPEISQLTIAMLRQVVGLEPAERVPEEALAVADKVLKDHGTDGLRLLAVSLTGWAAAGIERDAQLTGRTLEAVLDGMELACLEANQDG
ncbi:hypothetical protein ACFV2U_04775 [Streptomyces sp. NPDC059697]|uniref:hypothetical protein n=1 Tax=Streptomyces sp. NPDC059697 TaxID=3346912 RepID=UPI003691C82C